MNRRRVLEVELVNRSCAYLRGPGARELVVEVSGRPPVWSSLRRAFTVQETTARDVMAAAELCRYDIVVTGPRGGDLHGTDNSTTSGAEDHVDTSIFSKPGAPVVEHPDLAVGLW